MSVDMVTSLRKLVIFAGMSLAIAGCNGGNGAQSPPFSANGNSLNAASPPTNYVLIEDATWQNWPPATGNTSFDIGWVDPKAGQYYVADRNNSGVSVINTQSGGFLLTAGAGSFTGTAASPRGGPNGVVSIGNGIVFAGDGNSTMKVVNANTGALLATTPAVNPYTGPPIPATCGGTGIPTTGAANARVDEMAFDPTDGVVLAMNDASCPPFGTFFSTTAPYAAVGGFALPTANGGAEQPTWDPGQGLFILAIPFTIPNPNGEIDLISPTTHAIVKAVGLTSPCQPNGTALGKNETLFLGCGNTAQILTVSATNPATIITALTGHGGCDEVYYNPTADRFYAACSNDMTPDIVVTNGSGALITTITQGLGGSHSVAVDPVQDHVFVPTQRSGLAIFGH